MGGGIINMEWMKKNKKFSMLQAGENTKYSGKIFCRSYNLSCSVNNENTYQRKWGVSNTTGSGIGNILKWDEMNIE